MWKLLLREIFGVDFSAVKHLSGDISDLTEHYRQSLPDFSFDRVLVCAPYDWEVENAIHRFKYGRIREEASLLATLIFPAFDMIANTSEERGQYIFTWVPVGFFRFLSRWFNQSELLVKTHVENNWGKCRKCLTRLFSGKHQARLSAQERLNNAKNSFKPAMSSTKAIRGKHVILIDDVISTGATANECAKVLKMSGAVKVTGIFLARSEVK